MVNFDQAEGLRRMLFGAKPRFVTFLSALTGDEKNATLVNLSAGLARLGNDVVLLDARTNGSSVARWLEKHIDTTLLDVAQQKRTIQQATFSVQQGFKLASLSRCQNLSSTFQATYTTLTKLNKVVEKLGHSVDIVLVDGELSGVDQLATAVLEEGEIVIQLTNQSDSIKNAYSLIKRAHNKYGRREYGLLVTGVNEFEARRVYEAMAKAAGNFLSVPINLVGYVPQDDYLRMATRAGRSVIDAFPAAGASMAFSRLAQQLTANEFATTL
ncbi:flagellar biosynthesis protein FlhG [Oxalobacteraceae bacterium GrIS 2.11]